MTATKLTADQRKLVNETQRVGEAILDELPAFLHEVVPKNADEDAKAAGIILALLHHVLFFRRLHQCFNDQDPADDRQQFINLCNSAYDDFSGEAS